MIRRPPDFASALARNNNSIRADLVGINQATCRGVTVTGRNAPVALCRALIEAGHDPETSLEAYRGAALCLRVRSLAEGAAVTVREATKDGRPRFVKLSGDVAALNANGGVQGSHRSDFEGDPLSASPEACVDALGAQS
jgi:hypothetical protein